MEWIKRGAGNTLQEIVVANTGMSVNDLLNDKKIYTYPGITESVALFLDHVKRGSIIRVYADYDTDGVDSASGFNYLFTALGIYNTKILTPRRFSDGYGININRVNEFIAEGCNLLITVDNGIAGIEAIQAAREAGVDVIVLDHHLPVVDENTKQVILPNANIIVDPHITGGDFDDLCGAGITLRFADEVLNQLGDSVSPEKKQLIHSRICAFAAVGTIGDVVSLTKDNRKIVKEGINYMQYSQCTVGLKELLNAFGTNKVTSIDIGFSISAGINAAGRLEDNGAAEMTALLSYETLSPDLQTLCMEAKDRNDLRKKMTLDAIEESKKHYASIGKIDNFIVYYNDELPIGIAGLVAQRLVEEYHRPAIALGPHPNDPTILKGSGRSIDGVHLKGLLDDIKDTGTMLGYGGHSAACGVTITSDKLEAFKYAINMVAPPAKPLTEIYYDIELEANKDVLMQFAKESEMFEPYGAGNPEVIIKLSNVKLGDKWGNTYKFMGAEHQHVKLCGDGFDITWFNAAKTYSNMGSPKCVDVLGTVSINEFKGKLTPQVMPIAVKPAGF